MGFFNRIRFHILKFFKPVMVGRYKRHDGEKLLRTRVSNSTAIQGERNLDIEDNVFIGHFNFIDASNGLKIEEGCQITNYVSILTHSSHISIRLYGHAYNQTEKMIAYGSAPVSIGKFTFVGPHSVIMPGTTIGKGSLISAFSYVKGDFPDFSIIQGNPATRIGDTRDLDRTWLEANEELRVYYEEWSK